MNETAGTSDTIKVLRNNILVGSHGRQFLADIALSVKGPDSPVIIFSHGFKGFKDWGPFNLMADDFAKAGFHFVKFNFAFNGTTLESPYDFVDLEAFGNNNFTHELNDLEIVIDWVENKVPDVRPSNVFLLGHSRGGGISILKTSKNSRIKGTVAWGSVSTFTRYISDSEIKDWKQSGVMYVENERTNQNMPLFIQFYDDYIKNKHHLDILQAVTILENPVLLIHGSDDETVPISHARELAAHGELISLLEVPFAGHTFGATHPLETPGIPPQLNDVIEQTIRFYNDLIN